MKEYVGSWYAHLEMVIGMTLFGLLFNIIDMLTDKTNIRRMSFGKLIIIKSLLYLCMSFIVFLIVYGVFYVFEIGPFENPEVMLVLINSKLIISWIIYYIFSILLITFIVQVNKKFGPGNMFKLITGRYHKPREEERIFLFLDLKDSTTIAEKLGNNIYSQLLTNCFHDLTDVVIKYRADVYQYVGDEVVLSWKIKDGLRTDNCVKLYFAFKRKLMKKREFYLKQFSTYPEFKGGMDMGIVTVAEVGDIKSEIAFHGDVLNTASRIQGECKVHNKDLLISENLEKKINNENSFKKELIGEVILRGKEQIIKLYSIDLDDEE